MATYAGWRKAVAIAFYLLSFLSLLLSVERMVFDVFGQMWGTMLINGMTALCILTGMAGVCIPERLAIGVYCTWNVISIGLNLVVIFIYNDVGLLNEKEHYLGLTLGNDNWWRRNGIGCPDTSVEEAGSGGRRRMEEECLVSYAVTETIHAAIYMALAVVTLVLSVALLFPERKAVVFYPDDDDESFSYVNISRPHHYFRRWTHTYKTSNTTI